MSGDIVDVFAIGDGGNQALQFASTTGVTPTPTMATVTVSHFAPFADSVDGTSVTVKIDGNVVLNNFKFGDTVEDLPLAAGDYLIEILPSGTDTVAISGNVNVEAGMDYTLAAIGNGGLQPLELLALVDDNMGVSDKAKVRIGHLAPFSSDLESTKVDICTEANAVVVAGVPYKVVTEPYLELEPGDYDLKIALAGTDCAQTAIDLPAMTLAAGQIASIYAIGDIENLDLGTVMGSSVPRGMIEGAALDIAIYLPTLFN